MAKSFVLNHFLRHLDPILLETYFARYNIPFSAIPFNTNPQLVNAVIQVLSNLPPELITDIEAELSQINELATYTAQTILLDIAQLKKLQLPDGIANMTQYDTALWFFLHAPTIFSQVLRDYELEDSIGWREFLVPKQSQQLIINRVQALQAALQAHLITQEYRGANCIVEYYLKRETIFYIAYPEDYTKVKVVYSGPQQLDKQVCKPVQRIYFRYDPSVGLLGIKGFRGLRKLEAYREIFCQTVLGNKSIAQKRYLCNLSSLIDPDFRLVWGPEVDRVVITSIMVTLPNQGYKITLDFHTDAPVNIPELHDQLRQRNLPVEHLTIIRAKFCFKFKASVISQGRSSITCYLATPNIHNLADKPLHHQVMAYFKRWGLYHLAVDETSTASPQP